MPSAFQIQIRQGLTLIALSLTCAGCVTLPTNPASQAKSLVPTRYKLETGPYTVYTNSPLSKNSPEVQQLIKLEDQLQNTLDLKIADQQDPIEIYILDDRASFNHFLTFYYSELPPRRAFFFAQGNRRVVYTFHGKSLEQDLRHEATHALLHASVINLPLWLDEGLAEYFEVEDKLEGLNPEHLGKLRSDVKTGWQPDLARLETLDDVRQNESSVNEVKRSIGRKISGDVASSNFHPLGMVLVEANRIDVGGHDSPRRSHLVSKPLHELRVAGAHFPTLPAGGESTREESRLRDRIEQCTEGVEAKSGQFVSVWH